MIRGSNPAIIEKYLKGERELNKKSLKRLIDVAAGRVPADLVLKMPRWWMFIRQKSCREMSPLWMEESRESVRVIRSRKH